MRNREFDKRFSLVSMKDKESRRIVVKVYDHLHGRSFVYYENEIKNIPEKMSDLKHYIESHWEDIKKGIHEVDHFNQFGAID
ncbi:hypothetical protein [Gracilibacillus sp. YIM 98692]|uniref:hypothetical protein n=1 Tax=Gracilibacillus sp. YIM 98692 TaxID=2663532 RepID=UPI0013D6DB62|nr:hypothetical protein [Gracilibacillus sp. YIM 98692]